MIDDIMKRFDDRLASVEKDVRSIKAAVNNISLEKKLGGAIENIENKLDSLTNIICSQKEPVYLNMAGYEVRMACMATYSTKNYC